MNMQQVKSLEGVVPISRWMKKKEWQNYRHISRIMQNNKPQEENTQATDPLEDNSQSREENPQQRTNRFDYHEDEFDEDY